MTKKDKMLDTVNEIVGLLQINFDGPKDAAKCLLLAHATMTKMSGLNDQQVNAMLTEYWHLFRQAYHGESDVQLRQ